MPTSYTFTLLFCDTWAEHITQSNADLSGM